MLGWALYLYIFVGGLGLCEFFEWVEIKKILTCYHTSTIEIVLLGFIYINIGSIRLSDFFE